MSLVAIFILIWTFPLHAFVTPIDSIYTDLAPDRCKTVKVDKENSGSAQQCAGVAGYSLLVEDADARQSVTVLAPDGKRHPLDYWRVITTAFSTVGDKAEWRVKGERPVALIVRVFANENPDSRRRRRHIWLWQRSRRRRFVSRRVLKVELQQMKKRGERRIIRHGPPALNKLTSRRRQNLYVY